MNRNIKSAIKTIAEELAKQELEIAINIHKQNCQKYAETPTLKDWLNECMSDPEHLLTDLDNVQQAIGEQLVKQFKKLSKDAIARGW